MKLKILSGLIIFSLLLTSGISYAAQKRENIPNSFVYQAINKYKQKNYTGCIQDMEYVIKKGKPTDLVYYYQAISYSQLGMQDQARTAYEAASNITSNAMLKTYANQALECINDNSLCVSNLDDSDITKFITSEKFMHEDVENELQNQAIERVKTEINSNARPSDDALKYINYDNQPTDKEIADAVRTFSKLGINPFGNMNSSSLSFNQSPDLMQMNAFFGNKGGNNNLMDLIPMMSAMQGRQGADKTQMNKQFVQAYMLNQMLPNFNFGNNDK